VPLATYDGDRQLLIGQVNGAFLPAPAHDGRVLIIALITGAGERHHFLGERFADGA
jgi:hypothetical protein